MSPLRPLLLGLVVAAAGCAATPGEPTIFDQAGVNHPEALFDVATRSAKLRQVSAGTGERKGERGRANLRARERRAGLRPADRPVARGGEGRRRHQQRRPRHGARAERQRLLRPLPERPGPRPAGRRRSPPPRRRQRLDRGEPELDQRRRGDQRHGRPAPRLAHPATDRRADARGPRRDRGLARPPRRAGRRASRRQQPRRRPRRRGHDARPDARRRRALPQGRAEGFIAQLAAMRADGSFPAEADRGRGALQNQSRNIAFLVYAAEIAASQGENLYGARSTARASTTRSASSSPPPTTTPSSTATPPRTATRRRPRPTSPRRAARSVRLDRARLGDALHPALPALGAERGDPRPRHHRPPHLERHGGRQRHLLRQAALEPIRLPR